MKNVTLILSIIGSLILFVLFNTRQFGVCAVYCGDGINKYQDIFLVFPFILVFSIVTFWMPNKVFNSWWNFIKFTIPVIIFLSLVISLEFHHRPGGWFNMNDQFDLMAQFILYFIFTFGSIIQIIRGYRSKNK